MLHIRRLSMVPSIAAVFGLCVLFQSVAAVDDAVLNELMEELGLAPQGLLSADGAPSQLISDGETQKSRPAFMIYGDETPGEVVDGSENPFGNLLAEEAAFNPEFQSENGDRPIRQWGNNGFSGASGPREESCRRTTCSCYQQPGPTGRPGRRGLPGPQGPQGREGPQGSMGGPGRKGQPGRSGRNGNNAFRGPKGDGGRNGGRGAPGIKGSLGPIGRRGAAGLAGNRGQAGPKGERGTDGRNGCDGRDGVNGRNGIPGRMGLQGLAGGAGPKGNPGLGEPVPGPKGARGVRGIKGSPGRAGRNGFPGSRGDKGDLGDVGRRGRQGAPGPRGRKGQIGDYGTGRKGGRGPAGYPGQAGQKGAKGFAGARGDTGAAGQKGDRGTDLQSIGVPGPSGRQGLVGERGPDGRQGPTGRKGVNGPQGYQGSRGVEGPIGGAGQPGSCDLSGNAFKGSKGFPGPVGAPGSPGFNGVDGRVGQPGLKGERGRAGIRGNSGVKGRAGTNGRDGAPGIPGSDGNGRVGPQGPKGLKGDMGLRGESGFAGYPGQKGEAARGPSGQKGNRGPEGRPGPAGMMGPRGEKGFDGETGAFGPRGPDGMTGEMGQACSGLMSSYIYARHSQNTDAPKCAHSDHIQLWTGFSLLHTEDEGRAQVQDLGRSGSCLRQFEAMPFIFCGANEVCTWGARTATSYWLSSDTRSQYINMYGLDDSRERPLVGDEEKLQQISRCSVCLSYAPLLAIHSQNSTIPECPSGAWTSLWTGYSFSMHTVGIMGGGQPLESPGSCLQHFRHHPYIECTADGRCAYFSEKMTYWLAASDQMSRGSFNSAVVRNRNEAERSIARCRVCSLRTDNMYGL